LKKDEEKFDDLCQTILTLKDIDETRNFLKDLCTPAEIKAISDRWMICQLLDENLHSYREINLKTKASLATITRIARFLKDETNCGYRTILNKIKRGQTK